ncbi:MAG: DUF1376 domain-containing protein [Pseudomonadota bacterium]
MLPYYKRYPRKFFDATIGWNWEEKSIYGLVIDLIFMLDGKLPDDARYIAGQLGCSVRKWNSIREKLIISGKLEVKNEIISNKTADDLLIEQRSYRDKKAENRSRPNKNKDLKSRPSTVSRDKKILDKKDTISSEIVSQKIPKPIDDLTAAFDAYQSASHRLKARNGGSTVWPLVRDLSKERRAALRRILDKHGLDAWLEVLGKAEASPHCTGRNDRGWTASFDFFTSPSKFLKTLEGNYDERSHHSAARSAGNSARRNRTSGSPDGFEEFRAKYGLEERLEQPRQTRLWDSGSEDEIIDVTPVEITG